MGDTGVLELSPQPSMKKLSMPKLPEVGFTPEATILGSGKMRMAMSEKLGRKFVGVSLNTKGNKLLLVGRLLKRIFFRAVYGVAVLSELIASVVEIPVTFVRIVFNSVKDRPFAKKLAIVHGKVLIENVFRLFYFAPTVVAQKHTPPLVVDYDPLIDDGL